MVASPSRFARRAFLGGAVAGLLVPRRSFGGPRFLSNPFSLGVASGCPGPGELVLWTRLAPDPLHGGGMFEDVVEVRWELALDDRFQKIVRKGSTFAVTELAHSVHAELIGLEPDRWYYYRFFAGGEESPIGRTRTLPAPGASTAKLRFGFGSCQHYEHGWFSAYRHLLAEEVDLMIFLGDYIYELTWGENLVRRHSGADIARSLQDYRNRHAQYKLDPDLQKFHGHVPWLSTWDDHEVANDYAGLGAQNLDPDFPARRAAAYQAFWEHFPLRMNQRPSGGSTRIYERFRFGNLAEIYLLDGRQYRTVQACPRPGMAGGNMVSDCPALADPARSFLGLEQEKWLAQGLSKASAQWNVLAQPTLMAAADEKPGEGRLYWTDGWDGYPAARKRLLEQLAQPRVHNPVVIGGDVHTSFVADLKLDFDQPKSKVIASEVVGTSISSQSYPQSRTEAVLRENPHLKLGRSDKRGYTVIELGAKRMIATLRGLDDERSRTSGVSTIATFVVESGKPGPVPG